MKRETYAGTEDAREDRSTGFEHYERAAVNPDDLTRFQTRILTILYEESRYGLAIKEALEEFYGEEILHGRLYPNLDELADYGLLEKSELDRRTNNYELTPAGEAVIEIEHHWMAERIVDDTQVGGR